MSVVITIGCCIIALLGFITLRQSYKITLLDETIKDKDAKIASLLNYTETLTAKKVKKGK